VVLALVVCVVTLWLGVTGQLVLYIHPRYVVFTMIMAGLALVIGLATLTVRASHDHEEPPRYRWLSVTGLALAAVVAIVLVVVPPATLTSSTAIQRDINSTGVGAGAQTIDTAGPANASSHFSVLDWASLLSQTNDPAFYADRAADVTGFITASPDDPANVFYVSRFIITCCAVDAQPVGVPVYQPNWQDTLAADDWVRVTGDFASNPSTKSADPIALVPTGVTETETPDDPYLF
jgi:putative membrane protein